MWKWKCVFYKKVSGQVPVAEFIENQEAEISEQIWSAIDRLEEHNVVLPSDHAERVRGRDFWELKGRVNEENEEGCSVFYWPTAGRKYVLLHAVHKKGEKIPKKDLDLTERRRRDYVDRTGPA